MRTKRLLQLIQSEIAEIRGEHKSAVASLEQIDVAVAKLATSVRIMRAQFTQLRTELTKEKK